MEQRFIGMEDLAVYLGVSRYTIRAWIYRDKILCTRIGRAIRFDIRQIEKIFAKEEVLAQMQNFV
jgi:excisionase family DNA binding protein